MIHKAENIYYLAFYRKSSLASALDQHCPIKYNMDDISTFLEALLKKGKRNMGTLILGRYRILLNLSKIPPFH